MTKTTKPTTTKPAKRAAKRPAVRVLPKSLHTLTAFENLAAWFVLQNGAEYDDAVEAACEILGYDELPDVYGLKAKAIENLAARFLAARDATA